MSEMLEKARKYEDEQGKKIKAEDRPAFHVSPYIGWMNDPNGFHTIRESTIFLSVSSIRYTLEQYALGTCG